MSMYYLVITLMIYAYVRRVLDLIRPDIQKHVIDKQAKPKGDIAIVMYAKYLLGRQRVSEITEERKSGFKELYVFEPDHAVAPPAR